ncbi:MoaD/ThiS family protein [Cyanobacterium aponinum AL20118]|uniref:Molybdopterin synthase sulfur carrier subunit n=2 Tax=Cyanobacterium aponinum TaxID=379064 RepID=K9Z931_CYAAP|nr:MoaD/ThiS family protein [Cyanobacterium aponinum]AFZ55222.1 thiamine S protein [Cyanobacterium aponinum PCC 10605]WPF88391.1 MoaD/ThiS family protein [Cyanobacterium aponinum AL20115]
MKENKHKITVIVKLFAIYQETYQKEEITLKLEKEITVKQLLQDFIVQEKPELKPWENITRFAVNLQFVEPNFILNDQDEIALIPPVSGG